MGFLDDGLLKPTFDESIWTSDGSLSPRCLTPRHAEHSNTYLGRKAVDDAHTTIAEKTVSSSVSGAESYNEYNVQYERMQERRSLAGVVYGPPPTAQPGHYKLPAPKGSIEPRIIRTRGSDFTKRSSNAVIEVLLEEPRVSIRGRQRKASTVCDGSIKHTIALETPVIRQRPKRIRIQSPKLLTTLELIAQSVGQSFLSSGPSSCVRKAYKTTPYMVIALKQISRCSSIRSSCSAI